MKIRIQMPYASVQALREWMLTFVSMTVGLVTSSA
jgi:hypothetical protein